MWFMVYEKATGRSVSCGTVLSSPMPEAFGVAELGPGEPDFGKVEWDAEGLCMRPLPPAEDDA